MNNTEPTLPSNRAFVVQFYSLSARQAEGWAGRVEHMHSGRALRFASAEELWTFLTELLANTDEKPP